MFISFLLFSLASYLLHLLEFRMSYSFLADQYASIVSKILLLSIVNTPSRRVTLLLIAEILIKEEALETEIPNI